ncbi:MAG: hypothetical protein E7Z92_02270 [Cyanobacteria bacterium SIG31]|nr:hypothetical protein [Cyanobacteria bacterium SIG31]
MKIQQDNSVFGRLYMPTKPQIASVYGEQLAQKVEVSRTKLAELAKDVDIFVSTYIRLTERQALPIFKVLVKNVDTLDKHNSLLDILKKIFVREGSYVDGMSDTIAEDIVAIAKRQKSKLEPLN